MRNAQTGPRQSASAMPFYDSGMRFAIERTQGDKPASINIETHEPHCSTQRAARLPRVKLDDQLFVDDRRNLVAGRNASDFPGESVLVENEPIRHRADLSEIEETGGEATGLRVVADDDGVATLHAV